MKVISFDPSLDRCAKRLQIPREITRIMRLLTVHQVAFMLAKVSHFYVYLHVLPLSGNGADPQQRGKVKRRGSKK